MPIIVLIIEFLIMSVSKGPSENVSNILVVFFIIVFTFSFFVSVSNNRKLGPFASSIIVAYLVRLFYVFFDTFGRNIYLLPNSHADAEGFYNEAIRYSEQRGYTNHLFIKMMGELFRLIGNNRFYAQFLLSLLGVLAIIFTIKALLVADVPNEIIKKATLFAAILPNGAMLSSFFMRESVVLLFISVSLYYFVRWFVNKSAISFILAFIFCIVASAFHSGAVALAMGYIIIRILYDAENNKFHFSIAGITSGVLLMFVFVFLFSRYKDTLFSKLSGIESLEDIAALSTEGGSSYARFVGNSNNPINLVIFTIPRMIFFMFSPIPLLQWRGLADIIAFCFSSLYYFHILSKSVKALRFGQSRMSQLLIAFIIISFCAMFVFGWGCTNSGTALRHREKLLTLFTIMYALSSNMLIYDNYKAEYELIEEDT